jgi:hypothetical protein
MVSQTIAPLSWLVVKPVIPGPEHSKGARE